MGETRRYRHGVISTSTPVTDQLAESERQALKVGVGAIVINPPLDVPLAGYYYARTPEGIHDDLYAKALVFEDGSEQIALVACDLVRLPRGAVEDARLRIRKSLGIPPDHILVTATHSHTGPQLVPEYVEKLKLWISESVETAVRNKQPAQLRQAEEDEPSLPHNRRYLMKNGSTVTNPGFLNPDVVKPVGPVDPRLAVLTAETAEGRRVMTWVNYGLHQDTVGGRLISADYSYFLGRALSASQGPDMTTIFTIGAAADINHWDVRQPGPQRGFATAQRIGEVLAAGVLKAYSHLNPVEPGPIRARSSMLTLPLQDISDDDVRRAADILSVPPPPDVDFTLDRVWATKITKIHNRKARDLRVELQVLAIGSVAFVGIPGELFTRLGRQIINGSPFAQTCILELANDDIGYIPTQEAFDQGGYEPASSVLAPGAGENIVSEALVLLNECYR